MAIFHEGGHPAEELDDAPFYLCKQTTLDLINDAPTVIAAIRAQFPGQQIRIIAIDTLNRSLRESGAETKICRPIFEPRSRLPKNSNA